MSPAIMTHLALIYLPLTTALMLASTSALFFYKIDRGRHEDNLKALANAAALVEAFDPQLEISEGPGIVTRPT
jgi:Na+/melibiose symporter-like transporter